MAEQIEQRKKRSQQIVFHLFRYQILPTTQTIQLRFDSPVKNLEDLKAKKNNFFSQALTGMKRINYSRTELTHKVSEIDKDFYLIKLAAKRSLKRSTRDFKEEKIENWPATNIIINNHPAVQKAIIQFNQKVFNDTKNIADILQDSLNDMLKEYQLHVIFEKIFDEVKFWQVVNLYKNRIIQAEFELISPNLANISKSLQFDLQALNRSTNTQKTKLQLNSDKEAILTLSQEDPLVSGLVDYASQGGGKINLKVRGLNKKIHTSDKATEITIDEMVFNNADPKDILKIIGGIIK
ncbi:MAG: hypothetical protein WC695_08100 [Candidatus Omnitrophota bacterium]